MFFADRKGRINHSGPLRRFVASRKETVFPFQSYGPYCIFNKVIVNKKAFIVEIIPARLNIGYRFPDLACGPGAFLPEDPFSQFVDHVVGWRYFDWFTFSAT